MSSFATVARNAGWNLLGNAAPLAAAVLGVPYLVHTLGVERFGLLGLVWVLIGYFSLFDFGLGRAITQLVAQRAAAPRTDALDAICATGVVAATAAGLFGAALVAVAALWDAASTLGVSPVLQAEFNGTLAIVAVGLPAVVATSAYRGVLEGFGRFRLLNIIRMPAGVLLFAVPCGVATISPRLEYSAAALVATRLAILAAHALACRSLVTVGLRHTSRAWARTMLRFGGWLTVSNAVGPVILYADRFIIGPVASAAVLAYYTAPMEVVTRLLVLPIALTSALFPALSAAAASDPALARDLQRKAHRLLLAASVLVAMAGIALAPQLLGLWLGADFAAQGTLPMRILFIGFVFNALSQVPATVLYGSGRPRAVALLHTLELPVYLLALAAFTSVWGLTGAALAWTARALLDYLALSFLARQPGARLLPRLPQLPIGLSMVLVIALPSALSYAGRASSHAAGLCVASLLVLGMAFAWRKSTPGVLWVDLSRAWRWSALLLLFVVSHLVLASVFQNIDWRRALLSLVPLVLLLVAAALLACLLVRADPRRLERAVWLVAGLLLASALFSRLQIQPFWGLYFQTPVFPFTEPSHFALVFSGIALYGVARLHGWRQMLWLAGCVAVTLLLKNLTLAVACTIALVVALRVRALVVLLIGGAAVLSRIDLTHYIERLDFSATTTNLSTLVYLQGWQFIRAELLGSWGWGIGFQQLGLHGTWVPASSAIVAVADRSANLLDGGFTVVKVVAEFGVFGMAAMAVYLYAAARCAWCLRKAALGRRALPPAAAWCSAIFVAFSVELFVRGAGYFTATSLLFFASTAALLLTNFDGRNDGVHAFRR